MFRYLLEGADDYFEHIGKYKEAYRNGQRNNQYSIDISMEAPVSKPFLEEVFFKSISITFEGFENEPVELGSGNIHTFSGRTPLKIDMVLHEMFDYNVNDSDKKERDLYSYFFMNNGEPILPKDGTFLLPYEYYFSIDIYAVRHSTTMLQMDRAGASDNKYLAMAQNGLAKLNKFLGAKDTTMKFKPIISGEFILDGQTQLNWVNANNGENQELVLSFVPINSNQITRFGEI